jgi:hypothetical protein
MRALVAELRRRDGRLPAHRLPFELARRLKAVPGAEPMGLEPVVLEFCRMMGLPPAEGFGEFVGCWERVRNPEGQDAWDDAVGLARVGPLRMIPSPGETYRVEAAVCYCLSAIRDGGPFPLPLGRLAKSFGYSVQTASNVVRSLTVARVIRCVDPDYSYTRGKAREFRFLARVDDAPRSG